MRRLVSGVAVLAEGIDADHVEAVLVAVSEAFTNAMEAQSQAGVTEPIRVECRFLDQVFEVLVEDAAGDGFDPTDVPARPSRSQAEHLDIARGWGIELMRSLVSEVHFESTGRGTRVRLVLCPAGNPGPRRP